MLATSSTAHLKHAKEEANTSHHAAIYTLNSSTGHVASIAS